MFRVRRVEVDGFWGSFNLKTNLKDDVNIFIGRNGSGKTTFINLLEASLTADLDLLESIQFNEIRIWLTNNNKERRISIHKIPSVPFDKISFKIGRNSKELQLLPREIETRSRRLEQRHSEDTDEVRKSLSDLINISWLSVHRELLEDEYRDPYTRRSMQEKNPIERRLESLTKRFTQYQLQLQSEINRLSTEFRRNVLASMLYSTQFDSFHPQQEDYPDLESVKQALLRTYQDLGALDQSIEQKINEHIKKIDKAISVLRAFAEKKTKGITIDDVLPVSLLRRTQHVVTLSADLERGKNEILGPVNVYINILKKFAKDKDFILSPESSGDLLIRKGNNFLALDQLSSGEKQLFILLTEALLQKSQQYIFIADEPELSLHINWQKNVISSIRTLNPNSQIIVATHAPQIAGGWRDRIIRMEEIINE